MTGWDDDLRVFTVGPRPREALRDAPISRLCREAEGLLDEGVRREIELELERVTFASIVVDERDLAGDMNCNQLVHDAVSFLRKRMPVRPLVVIGVSATRAGEWNPAWLVSLSRGLGAPVVRAAEPTKLPTWELATLWWESLGPGLTGIDGRDVETAFQRVSSGVVFRWRPWKAGALGAMPPALSGALRDESVASVFITYRFGSAGTLHRVDTVVSAIQAAAPEHADVLFATPTVEAVEDEVLVTVVHARGR